MAKLLASLKAAATAAAENAKATAANKVCRGYVELDRGGVNLPVCHCCAGQHRKKIIMCVCVCVYIFWFWGGNIHELWLLL